MANVSTATVSRCLNEPARVREETRNAVAQAIEALGYVPNHGARSLASRRTRTVGAIVPTLENSIFARGLQAFQGEMATSGSTLLVASSNYDPAEEARQVRTLAARGIDGLLLIGTARAAETYELLAQRSLPHVVAWSLRRDGGPYVGFDNRAAAHEMTRTVIEHGHRRLAMIAGVTRDNDRAAERLGGFRDAVAAGGSDVTIASTVESRYTLEEAGGAFRQMWTGDESAPSVVVCGNDVLAVGAMMEARRMGLKIPEVVSFTGFDDIDLAEIVTPSLTTVHVPHRRMGAEGARMLRGLIAGQVETTAIVLDTHLVLRDSLGAPGRAR